ncbi:uncharacterized protein LOC143289056 [Babylonia areolata]|uniref:uncharacterized protein LOC143289056 n=1 Tax=Babylonia areolata TaxID=304850 RepID=UPI003FD4AE10
MTRVSARMMIIASSILLVFNVVVISLAVRSIPRERSKQCQKGRAKNVVAPLCVPCENEWTEEEGGWRRYMDEGQSLCCPLRHDNLASAVGQIYYTVLQEKQQHFEISQGSAFFSAFYKKPGNTAQQVVFANNNKPSAHVTGIQRFDASECYKTENTSSSDTRDLQTMCDWPLRFEPYRSATRGYVQRLTWGLVVPVSGVYRVHSTINFLFYPQTTKMRLPKGEKPIRVVHQLARYRRAEGGSSVLAERNQTLSGRHTDGHTSFLLSVHQLTVGDVVSISLSHRAAMAVQDRWHSQGLFLLR